MITTVGGSLSRTTYSANARVVGALCASHPEAADTTVNDFVGKVSSEKGDLAEKAFQLQSIGEIGSAVELSIASLDQVISSCFTSPSPDVQACNPRANHLYSVAIPQDLNGAL